MKFFGRPTTEELARELLRSVTSPVADRRRSPIERWRRARFEFYLANADYAEVLRAYYVLQDEPPAAEVVGLRRAPRRRIAA